jgi:hypothetical protein
MFAVLFRMWKFGALEEIRTLAPDFIAMILSGDLLFDIDLLPHSLGEWHLRMLCREQMPTCNSRWTWSHLQAAESAPSPALHPRKSHYRPGS